MKKTTIAIALFLTFAMLLPCVTSCDLSGKNNDTTASVTKATPSSDPAVTTAEPDVTTVADITTSVDITTAEVTTSPEATTAPEVTTAPVVTTAETPVVTEPPHSHSYAAVWSQSATQHWHECSCGAKTDIAVHSFGDWTVTKEATETTAGEKNRTCSVCGYREVAVIPELNHTHSFASTWVSDEKSHWHPCSCGEKFGTANHTYGEWIVVTEATCVTVGSIKRTCSVCGFVETASVEKTAHTVVTDPMIPATCTATGKTEGSHCSFCGLVIKSQSVIPATGHSFTSEWHSDGTNHWHECHCGERTDVSPHSPVTDEAVSPTCNTTGKTEGSHCSICNSVIIAQQDIPTTDHSFGEWAVTKEATCSEKGKKTRSCSVCGTVETQDIPLREHIFVSGVCTQCGAKDHYDENEYGTLSEEDKALLISKLPPLLPDGTPINDFVRPYCLDDELDNEGHFTNYYTEGNSGNTVQLVTEEQGAVFGTGYRFASYGKTAGGDRGEITVISYYEANPKGAMGVIFYVDFSHVEANPNKQLVASVSFNNNTYRSNKADNGSVGYYYLDGLWVETKNVNACRMEIPSNFVGWIYIPATSYVDFDRNPIADEQGKFMDITVNNMRCYTDGYIYGTDDTTYIIFDEIIYVY